MWQEPIHPSAFLALMEQSVLGRDQSLFKIEPSLPTYVHITIVT